MVTYCTVFRKLLYLHITIRAEADSITGANLIMATRRNIQHFTANVNGTFIQFTCWTTSTRAGFCHTASCNTHDLTDSKVSYYNRTWERFDYETVLSRAIDKLPKSLRYGATAQIIEKKSQEECEKADRIYNAFKNLHDRLTPENKAKLAASDIHMETEADASAVMGLMACMAIAQ